MAFSSGARSVGTTATFICTLPPGPCQLTLVMGTSGSVTIGGSAVTASNGMVIGANAQLQLPGFTASAPQDIYGITASGSVTVSYALTTSK